MTAIADFFTDLYDTYGIGWMIGQLFGIVAIILGFVSYQLRTKRQLLIMQTVVAIVFCVHYFLIGAYSAMAMNVLNIARNAVYDVRTRKGITSPVIPAIFVAAQVVICAIAWEAWYSIFVLLGIGINTYCMSFSNSQNVRKSILISSPLVLTYDIFASSLGGAVYESVAIISSVVGIIRNPKETAAENTEE